MNVYSNDVVKKHWNRNFVNKRLTTVSTKSGIVILMRRTIWNISTTPSTFNWSSAFMHAINMPPKDLKLTRLIYLRSNYLNYRRCSIKKCCSQKFRNIQEKQLCWRLFLIKLRAWRIWKEITTQLSLWMLQNF